MSINEKCCCECSEYDERVVKLASIIEEHKSVKGGLIPVLHSVQGIYGYLPEDILHIVSEGLGIPMTEIYGVATFYSFFSFLFI